MPAGMPSAIVDPGGAPRDSADVADAVAAAHASRHPLRIVAAGTWLDAGRPVQLAGRLDLANLRGIVEYVPGDLTLTARAATPLAEIDAATAVHGQWLPLDPLGAAEGTIGATIATASAGPLGASIGLPRDLALGVEFVSGEGERIRGGGRVVKNVAGFDLVRHQVGAWGTLGVITEVTVRLRGRPEVDRTCVVPLPASATGLDARVRTLAAVRGAPLAAEWVAGPLAESLGGPDGVVLVRLGGNVDAVEAQVRSLAALGDVRDAPAGTWTALRDTVPDASVTWRLSGAVAAFAATWARACTGAPAGATVHGTPARGIVRTAAPAHVDAVACVRHAIAGGPCIVERAPAAAWTHVPPAATDRLSSRLRVALDPGAILNRGIFGAEAGTSHA